VFRRRNPIPLWQRLRSWFWPQNGWQRAFAYVLMRLKRMPGTPHGIAAGVAAGVMVSFTPFFPHLATAALLAMILRGSVVAAWVGTLIGNPSTFPFIWLVAYNLGLMVMGHPPVSEPEFQVQSQLTTLPEPFTIEWVTGWVERTALWAKTRFLPMAIGGVPLGIAAGLGCYFPLVRIITAVQERRRAASQKKLGMVRRA
jgi:uncharacterized protein (DUF2062 family)